MRTGLRYASWLRHTMATRTSNTSAGSSCDGVLETIGLWGFVSWRIPGRGWLRKNAGDGSPVGYSAMRTARSCPPWHGVSSRRWGSTCNRFDLYGECRRSPFPAVIPAATPDVGPRGFASFEPRRVHGLVSASHGPAPVSHQVVYRTLSLRRPLRPRDEQERLLPGVHVGYRFAVEESVLFQHEADRLAPPLWNDDGRVELD